MKRFLSKCFTRNCQGFSFWDTNDLKVGLEVSSDMNCKTNNERQVGPDSVSCFTQIRSSILFTDFLDRQGSIFKGLDVKVAGDGFEITPLAIICFEERKKENEKLKKDFLLWKGKMMKKRGQKRTFSFQAKNCLSQGSNRGRESRQRHKKNHVRGGGKEKRIKLLWEKKKKKKKKKQSNSKGFLFAILFFLFSGDSFWRWFLSCVFCLPLNHRGYSYTQSLLFPRFVASSSCLQYTLLYLVPGFVKW